MTSASVSATIPLSEPSDSFSPRPVISVSVMTHPRRAAHAEALASAFEEFAVRVVTDPDPAGRPSTVRTAREAWKPFDHAATHHLVIQDDVFLHPQFEPQVIDAVAAQPDAVLSFFSEWGSFTSHAIRVGAFIGAAWIPQVDTYLGTQAALMKAGLAQEFADWLRGLSFEVPDDHALFEFAHTRGLKHFVSNPNLVEHDVGESLIGNASQGLRRATVFHGVSQAPRAWWQHQPMTGLRLLPAMHWSRPQPMLYAKPRRGVVRWDIRPPASAWGAFAGAVQQLVDDNLSAFVSRPGYGKLRAAVIVLCEQVAVASAHPGEHVSDRFGESCAIEAALTMVPGALRVEDGARDLVTDTALMAAVGVILQDVRRTLIPRLDPDTVSAYWSTSARG